MTDYIQLKADLLPCPFCGGKAEFERYGDRRQSSIVRCTDCGASMEANEIGSNNGAEWNTRISRW